LQDDQLLQTVFIGGVNLVFTILAMLLVDSMGRKPLMLLGAAALSVLYMIIGHLLAAGSGLVSWFLLGAIGIYALTLGPITWVLIAEIFPGDIRERATAIAVLFLWASYFILVFTFPILFDRMRNGIFYLYGLVCLGGLIFVARIRETKGRALEDAGNTTTMH
jgi:MFS transporter, SP family, xylose:H+ symportor